MKKVLSIILAIAMVLSCAVALSGCGDSADSKKVTLKIAMTSTPDGPLYPCYEKFCEVLEERLPDYFDIVTYDSSSLGGEGEIMAAMLDGTVQAVLASDGAIQSVDSLNYAEMGNVPFLVQTPSEFFTILEGDFGELLRSEYAKRGIQLTGFYIGDCVVIGNNKRPVYTPSDAAGMKIRIWQADGPYNFLKAVGALPTVMSITEVYTGLQQGTIDGSMTSCFQFNDQKWNENLKYITDAGVMVNYFNLEFNKEWFDALDKEAQDAIMYAGKVSQEWCRDVWTDEAMKQTREIATNDYGIEFIVPEKEQLQEWVDVSMGTWDYWRDFMGADVFDSVCKALGRKYTPAS